MNRGYEIYHLNEYVATAALGISTIVLGVNNADLKSQLSETSTVTEAPVTTTVKPQDMSKYRLPTSAVPASYDLYLYPDLKTGLFKGKVTAETTLKEATSSVVLHSNKLNVTDVTVDEEVAAFETDDVYELLIVRKRDGAQFSSGSKVTVTINFEGDMKNRIVGLYTSSYTNEEGQKR
ncbi:Peptidase M1 domain containing protein [Asbolus verrucosus]|uniref:Peptidase M1 domain containing protein n=1 Tax=Asbolus verrucosus TaxID=1661398 RepID=A0A482VNV5_ASBVE|nr:Peptidase M1 domain containing protein [Asbolus verrucosus]